MKYANHLILLFLLGVGFLLKDHMHLSSDLVSLFSIKESAQKIKIASELGYTKEMYVAIKGFDTQAKTQMLSISDELEKLEGIISVQNSLKLTREVQNYYKKYYPVLADFDASKRDKQDIRKSLKKLYDEQLNSIFYTPVNKDDPLGLFSLKPFSQTGLSKRGSYLALENYGYLIRVKTSVGPSAMKEAQVLYAKCQDVFSKYKDVISFAPFYYTVENSDYIQKDVQWIITLSVLILLLVYYFLLRNLSLLFETLIALFASMVFASLVSTLMFEDFHILSLAFGMSITAVSIDYLLHYHFHGFYYTKARVNRSVLYGFLTTLIAFVIFSFIPIPLISQISSFTVLSLSFAYLLFTFVFPYIKIKPYTKKETSTFNFNKIPSIVVFAASMLLFVYSSMNMSLEKNIRNLDYQNSALREVEQVFNQSNTVKLVPVIVTASSVDNLMSHLHTIKDQDSSSFSLASFVQHKERCIKKKSVLQQYDFNGLNRQVNAVAKELGFKEGYFHDAYRFAQELPPCDYTQINSFSSFNLGVYKGDKYFSMAFVKDLELIIADDFVSSINLQALFSKVAQSMYKDLLLYSTLVVFVIFILLGISVKRSFLYALNYILFPVSFSLAVLVSFTSINLMHLFALIIIIAIGIDYGIYMSNTQEKMNTILAVKYSLLSTFAGFGVLVFSSIVALYSIGVIVSLGVFAIFVLIKVMR
jgi:uncharacterized protein